MKEAPTPRAGQALGGWGCRGVVAVGEQAAGDRAARFAAARGRGELWVSQLSGHLRGQGYEASKVDSLKPHMYIHLGRHIILPPWVLLEPKYPREVRMGRGAGQDARRNTEDLGIQPRVG